MFDWNCDRNRIERERKKVCVSVSYITVDDDNNNCSFSLRKINKISCIKIVAKKIVYPNCGVVCALCTSFCSKIWSLGVCLCVFNVSAVFTSPRPQIFIVILCWLYPPQAVNTSMPEQFGTHDSNGPYIENIYKKNWIELNRVESTKNTMLKRK